MPTQRERTDATRAAIMAAGRRLFGKNGFSATSIDDLARAAGVTRGALYHHFASKETLFGAVFEAVERDLMAVTARAAVEQADAWGRLRAGSHAFLEASADPAIQRIALLDAPAVLGWDAWREIDERYFIALLRAGVEAAIAEGALPPRSAADALAHMLLGALTEAAMLMARTPARSKARAEIVATVDALLDGLGASRHS